MHMIISFLTFFFFFFPYKLRISGQLPTFHMQLSTLARHVSTLIDVYYTQTNPHNLTHTLKTMELGPFGVYI